MKRSLFVRVVLITAGLLLVGVLLDQRFALALVAVLWCLSVMAVCMYRSDRFKSWTTQPLISPNPALGEYYPAAKMLHGQLATSRKRTHTVIDSAKKYKDIANSLPDALVILDNQLSIDFVNRRASPLLGLTPKDIGTNITSLVRHPDAQVLFKADHGTVVGVEIPSPVNSEIPIELRLFSVSDKATMLLARDASDASRLLAMRQDFIANVSHELRTPLTVLMGYIESVFNDDLDQDTLIEIVRRLDAPAQRMKALVDDLLTLTRLESSPVPASSSLSEISGQSLISSIVDEVQTLVTPKHRILVEAEAGLTVRGVRSEIHSAILNLTTNALRYSPNGGDVVIKWHRHQEFARLSVQDHGVGIANQHLPRITERFYRVDPASSRVSGGTGLGLAIVKHVLIRHQSSLQVHSKLGQGSTFFCDLIIQPSTEESKTAHESS